MIMKSNNQSTPIEHLENHWPKCKMHTQERQLTHFLYFTTNLQRNRTDVFIKTKLKPNRTLGFSQNQTGIELEKSIPHIPNINITVCMKCSKNITWREHTAGDVSYHALVLNTTLYNNVIIYIYVFSKYCWHKLAPYVTYSWQKCWQYYYSIIVKDKYDAKDWTL